MMLSSVDLPQPLGPTMQRNSEVSMRETDAANARNRACRRVVIERNVACLDMGHGRFL